MTLTRAKAKNRRSEGAFVPIPVEVLNHINFKNLTGNGLRMFMYLCSQLRFKKGGTVNNGDLCATISLMKLNGWNSSDSINKAIKELTYYGFIVVSRAGNRRLCNLYAITCWAIDSCKNNLDIKETIVPLNFWQEKKNKWKRPNHKKLRSVLRIAD